MAGIEETYPPEVKACPLCDLASVLPTPTCELPYRCTSCHQKFEEPETRTRRAAGAPPTGSQKILLDADPSEYP